MNAAIIAALMSTAILCGVLLFRLADASELEREAEKLEEYVKYLEEQNKYLESLNAKYRHEAGEILQFPTRRDRT